jgi:hypothetical protein
MLAAYLSAEGNIAQGHLGYRQSTNIGAAR